jgi:hypothetical protein
MPRRSLKVIKVIAAVSAIPGLYGLLAGGALPFYLTTVLIPAWALENHLNLTLQSLQIDPFSPGLSLHQARLAGPDGKPLLAIDQATVAVRWRDSLSERALVLDAAVTGLSARLAYGPDGIRGFGGGRGQSAGSMPSYPVRLNQLLVNDSELAVRDETGTGRFERVFAPLTIRLDNFDLGTAAAAHYQASLPTRQGERLEVRGTLQRSPLKLAGTVDIHHLNWADWGQHYAPLAGFTWTGGDINLTSQYRLDTSAATRLELDLAGSANRLALATQAGQSLTLEHLDVDGGHYVFPGSHLTLRQVTLAELKPTPADSIRSLRLLGVGYEPREHRLQVRRIESDHAVLHPGLDASGRLHLSGWPAATDAVAPADSSVAAADWRVSLDELTLDQYDIDLLDARRKDAVQLPLHGASLRLRDVSTHATMPLKLELSTGIGTNGRLNLQGQGSLSPPTLEARLELNGLSLRPFQPYWDELTGFELLSGQVDLRGDIAVRPDSGQENFSGDIEITGIKTVDKREKKDFAGWESLRLNGIVLATQPRRASVKSINLKKPEARVVIDPEGSLNLVRQFLRDEARSAPVSEPPRATAATSPWPVVIGALHVVEGRMDFSDLTLQPRFTSEIRSLNGTIRGLSSQTRAEVNLAGQLNGDAPARISGQFNPFGQDNFTDITLTFKDVNLTNLSPYSGKFAGYRIEKGKLDLNLNYQVSGRKLKADNRMVLNQLVLGERVDSPEATRLPIRLALTLLRDADGRIDISLPISGRLDQPHFSVRSLLREAFAQTVTKVVSSPFSVLKKLVAWHDEEELSRIGFRPGESGLSESIQTSLNGVATILKQRPELDLDIKSQANWNEDRQVLAERAFRDHLDSLFRLAHRGHRPDGLAMDDSEYRRLVTAFFRENYPASPLLSGIPESSGATLEGTGLQTALARILADWPVDEMDLRQLAQRRSEAIRTYLVGQLGVPGARIFILDVTVKTEADADTRSLLGLSTTS